MKKVFIDGSAGTTGLRIKERLSKRSDIELIILPEELRKDSEARKKALNECDIAFLCLPDAAAIEAVNYYGGVVSGIASIFATVDNCLEYPVHSVFNPNDLENYELYPSHNCPMCKNGQKIDALVNSFGFSKL